MHPSSETEPTFAGGVLVRDLDMVGWLYTDEVEHLCQETVRVGTQVVVETDQECLLGVRAEPPFEVDRLLATVQVGERVPAIHVLSLPLYVRSDRILEGAGFGTHPDHVPVVRIRALDRIAKKDDETVRCGR